MTRNGAWRKLCYLSVSFNQHSLGACPMRGLGKSNTATVKKHKILPSRSFSSRQGEGVDKYLRPRALEVFRAGRAFSGLGCLGELGEEAAATQDLVGWLGGVKGGAAGWSEESLYTYLSCPSPCASDACGLWLGSSAGQQRLPRCPGSISRMVYAPHGWRPLSYVFLGSSLLTP